MIRDYLRLLGAMAAANLIDADRPLGWPDLLAFVILFVVIHTRPQNNS